MKTSIASIQAPSYMVLLFALAMMALVAISFLLSRPPAVVPADAPPALFSAERAAVHLPSIAAERHPIGSAANTRVKDYLVGALQNLSLEPVVHDLEYYDPLSQQAARLSNVMTRIRGTGDGGAILLMAHYDSVESSFGAADNGSAVASILELLRMLSHHPPLVNDVIVLFSDGEEVGLMGAKAFLEKHPWAGEVDLVFNLEARGSKGASMLFETGDGNRHMVAAFARGSRKPMGSSLGYEIYSRMPNDTDFSPFKQRGYQGLNIAYLDNPFDYHTEGDRIENLDIRAMQHQGEYLKDLVLYLGGITLDIEADQNAVFFNTIGFGFAHYPFALAIPLASISLLLFLLLLIPALKCKLIRPWKFLASSLVFVVYLFLVYVLFSALIKIISGYYPGMGRLLLYYNHQHLFLAFAGLWLAITLVFFRLCFTGMRLWQALTLLFAGGMLLWWAGSIDLLHGGGLLLATVILFLLARRPLTPAEIITGAQFVWLIPTWAAAILFKGISYLFVWPLIFSLTGFLILISLPAKYKSGWASLTILLLAALPALAWMPHIGYIFYLAMGVDMISIALILPALMAGLLAPHIDLITRNKSWLAPALALIAGCIFLYQGAFGLDFDQRHQKPNSILLAHDGNTETTWWMTSQLHHDTWTAQFLSGNPDTIPFNRFFPFSNALMIAHETTIAGPTAPYAQLLSDTLTSEGRRLAFHIVSPGRQRLEMYINAGNDPVHIWLNGNGPWEINTFRSATWRIMRYYAMQEEGVVLELQVNKNAEVEIQLLDIVSGFPEGIAKKPRLPHMRAHGDRTLASMKYAIQPY